MTQTELIQGMAQEIKSEIEFQINNQGKTEDDEKELAKLVRDKRKQYRLLLSTMGIKKSIDISLYTILTDVSDEAFRNKCSKNKLTYKRYLKEV